MDETAEYYKRKQEEAGYPSENTDNDALSCIYLEEDGSCSENRYAGCIAWVDWDENKRTTEPPEYFCKLSKEERAKYGE
jgi:hypothetical protein